MRRDITDHKGLARDMFLPQPLCVEIALVPLFFYGYRITNIKKATQGAKKRVLLCFALPCLVLQKTEKLQ